MSEAEARLHALLLIELLTAIAQEDEGEAGHDERPVPVAAAA
jgi:hypothetical protein